MQEEEVKRRLNPKNMANRPSPIHAMLTTGEGGGGKKERELHRKWAFSLGGKGDYFAYTQLFLRQYRKHGYIQIEISNRKTILRHKH